VKRLRARVLVSAEDNKAVIRRLIEEVYNEGHLDVVDELVAPDVFNHPAVPAHQYGIDGFKHVIEWVRDFSSTSAPTFITTSRTSSPKETRLRFA
jgi:SnoaL-like polyketide cyclase